MTTQAVHEPTSTLSLDDSDNDLVHVICNHCSRAWCDGVVCDLTEALATQDVVCAVCNDLDRVTTTCPYCGASPP